MLANTTNPRSGEKLITATYIHQPDASPAGDKWETHLTTVVQRFRHVGIPKQIALISILGSLGYKQDERCPNCF
jgi:hypothetical protein